MALNDIRDTVLTFVTKQAMMKQVQGCEFDVSKRTIAATKLQEGDAVVAVHAAPEQAHIELTAPVSYTHLDVYKRQGQDPYPGQGRGRACKGRQGTPRDHTDSVSYDGGKYREIPQ